MAADFTQWCRLCSFIEAELVVDVDQLIFIENTFNISTLNISICSSCKLKITNILDLIETSQHISQKFLDLQAVERSKNLNSEILNEIRSNYGLETSKSDDSGMSFENVNEKFFEEIEEIENCAANQPSNDNEKNQSKLCLRNSIENLQKLNKKQEKLTENPQEAPKNSQNLLKNRQFFLEIPEHQQKIMKNPKYLQILLINQQKLLRVPENQQNSFKILQEAQKNLPENQKNSQKLLKNRQKIKKNLQNEQKSTNSLQKIDKYPEKSTESSQKSSQNSKKQPSLIKNLQKVSENPQKSSFMCNFCGKNFDYKSVLNYHESTHQNALKDRQKFICDFDNIKFTTKSKLKEHLEAKHLGNFEFSCFCGRFFNRKVKFKEHLRDSHGNKHFNCDFCDFSTSSNMKLKVHNKTKHGSQIFTCEICFQTFKCEKYLKSHKITHEKEKKFQCEEQNCGKIFKRLRELKVHMNGHDESSPFACEFCPKTFADSANRNKHTQKIHPTSVSHMISTLGPKWRSKIKQNKKSKILIK